MGSTSRVHFDPNTMTQLYQLLTTLGTRTAPPAPSFPSLTTPILPSDEAAAAAAAGVAAGPAVTTAAPPRANSTVAAFKAKPTSISKRNNNNPPAAQRPIPSDGPQAPTAAMPKGWKPVYSQSTADAAAAEAVGEPAAEPSSPPQAGGKHNGAGAGAAGGLPQRERKSKSKKGSTTNYVLASNGPGPQAFGST